MAEVNNQESNVQENEVKQPEKSVEDVQVEQQDTENKKDNEGKHIAASSIMLGLLAGFTGIPVINVMLGFAGVGGAVKSFKPGSRILAVIGFIVSIGGSIWAIGATMYRFFPQVNENFAEWILYWLSNIL